MNRAVRARGAMRGGALVLSAALALSACSQSPSESSSGEASSGAASSDAAASGTSDSENGSELLPEAEGITSYPLVLESPWGETTLEERPMRIAAVSPSQDEVEALVAIGVTPILANEITTDLWIEESLTQPIPQRFTSGDTDFPIEQIAAAEPDLIITLNADVSAEYSRLSQIAPVLSTSQAEEGQKSVATDWDATLAAVGEALDLQQAAQAALTKQDEFFEQFQAEHPEFSGKSASYVVYYGAETGLQYHSTAGSPAGNVFERMGFVDNPNAEGLAYRDTVSNELLSKIDADIIIFSDNSKGAHAELTDSPLFQGLKAVQDNHLILIDNRVSEGQFVIGDTEYEGNLSWALARSGPLSSVWVAEQLAPALSQTLSE